MASSDSTALEADAIFRVDRLTAFITGGGTGIGLMMAKSLVANGAAKVYIAGRRLDVLEAAASSLGPNVVPVQCDVTSKESLQKAAALVEKESGHLNLLVCNSGISGPQVAPIESTTTLEQWADENLAHGFDAYVSTFAVNTAAVWYTAMSFLRLLDLGNKAQNLKQTSQIVVTTSVASFNKKAPGGWAYGQSKAAATHATKQLAVSLAQWNIRANCIAPGLFPSEMTAPVLEQRGGADAVLPTDVVPLARFGTSQEMGGTMLYLASRAGAYLSGSTILIDGGRLGNFPSTN